jgi:FkbM family methyltransferase
VADLYLADEIFRGEAYPIPFSEPTVVIDIGMNVGFAALEFARDSRVKRVYAYEPFRKTFQMAVENFSLNPEYQPKIVADCSGLSTKNEVRNVEYSETLRAGMTTNGIPKTAFSSGVLELETILLKEIYETLFPIVEAHPSERMILKMDCEGDEFELIPRLSETGILSRFDLIMIEFHRKSPDELFEILEGHGYDFTSATRSAQILFQGKQSNMIYAAKDSSYLE